MSSEASFKWNQAALDRIKHKTMEALVDLGQDTAYQAQRGAPVDTGALVNSIHIDDSKENVVYVLAGGKVGPFNVPYARRREYENRLHPNTRFYMKNALEWAYKNRNKYFKDITK